MNTVAILSPYRANSPDELALRIEYATRACRTALAQPLAPFASHLLYTRDGMLDDADEGERALGKRAGVAWFRCVDEIWLCVDLGVSEGMRDELREILKDAELAAKVDVVNLFDDQDGMLDYEARPLLSFDPDELADEIGDSEFDAFLEEIGEVFA